jgi:hypothetical protein
MGAVKQIAKATLSLKKSTKTTHVYNNDEHGLNLYFPKLLFGANAAQPPAEVTVTLEAVK